MNKFKRILSLLLAVMVCLSLFSVLAFADETETTDAESTDTSSETIVSGEVKPELFKNSDNYEIPASFTKVSENKNLTFYLDYSSGEYALYNKKDSTCLFSNPQDRAVDTVANTETSKYADSQMSVTYITSTFSISEKFSGEASIITETYGESQIISYFFDSESTSFIIPIMFTLKDDYLEVEVLIDSINEMGDSRIQTISLMYAFGAGNPQDDGYVLLPDGMGSLMTFNKSYQNVSVYKGYVYAEDPTADVSLTAYSYGVDLTETIHLPVYGVKKNNSGYVAIITQSEANVSLKAYCAGMLNSYNFVYPTINIRDSQTRRTGSGSSGAGVYYSDELPQNFVMRVYPLSGDDADYIGMANVYREYLIDEVGLEPMAEDTETSMNVTMIGAYKRTQHFLGIPYTGVDTMTTFKQAEEILKDLTDSGVDSMICGMIGWSDGGLEDAVSTSFNPESSLGGEKGAKGLLATAKELDIPLTFDVDLVNFYQSTGSYTKYDSTVYGLDMSPVAIFPFIVSLNRTDRNREEHYLFHPASMLSIATSFVQSASGYGIENFSFSTVGEELYAAYNTNDTYTRDKTANAITTLFSNVAEQVDGIITTAGGNAYAFPAVNNVIEAPLYSSELYYATTDVPFYHMALRGLVRLSGPAFNLSSETTDLILRSAQYGVGLYVVLSYESSSNLKDTSYNYYYSTQYSLWKDDIIDAYDRLKVVYDAVGTSIITDYTIVSENLKITTFSNGAKVYVNYGESDVTYNGIKIAAEDFTVVGGDK